MKSIFPIQNTSSQSAQKGRVDAFCANGLYPPPPPVISPRCAPCDGLGGHV
jgi:hypothetical protein